MLLIIKNRYLKLTMLVLFYVWADARIWGSLQFFLRSTSNYLWGLFIQSTGCLILSSWIPLRVHCQWAAAVGYNFTLLELGGEQRSLFFFVHTNMNIGVIYIIMLNSGTLGEASMPKCAWKASKRLVEFLKGTCGYFGEP